MVNNEVVTGLQRAWTIKEKLGEGDAGEVYRVESLIEKKPAILKRPVRAAFSSDVVRQAAQIEREARILRALAQHKFPDIQISTPKFLDQSPPGSEFSDRFFLIMTEAKGINLSGLARAVRFRTVNPDEIHLLSPAGLSSFENTYLETLVNSGQIPDLVILRVLDNLLMFLDCLHTISSQGEEPGYAGVVWNDIKPEHIFLQPQSGHITLIDWGNSHFLDASGATTDRRYARPDDFRQFLEEIGALLENTSLPLKSSLKWPSEKLDNQAINETISSLHSRIKAHLKKAVNDLEIAHQTEKKIIETQSFKYEDYLSLKQTQYQLLHLGEIPDFNTTRNFAIRIAEELIKAGEIGKFSTLCEQLSQDNAQDAKKWKLLAHISSLIPEEPALRSSLHYALKEEWPAVLWELRLAARYEPSPAWWPELSTITRELEFDGDHQPITPRTAIGRLILSLQSTIQYASQSTPPVSSENVISQDQANDANHLEERRKQLILNLKEEAIRRWSELEPVPPNSDIGYQEVVNYSKEILDLAPAAGKSLLQALEQPLAHYRIVMDAWERQEFETALRGLRRMLLWDPDRKRLITASLAIQSAAGWLARLRKGPHKDEALQDFVTRYELEGRETRNQVGPAGWLDSTLSALRQLRLGGESTETLVEYPLSRPYLSWLLELDSHKPILSIPGKQIQLQRKVLPERIDPGMRGVHETGLGDGQDIQISKPLDTWAPEASGSSARVFLGMLKGADRRNLPAAVKIMRPNRLDYALPLFREEVQILSLLRDVPGVASLIELGFLSLSDGNQLLSEENEKLADTFRGKAIRYGLDSTHNFLIDLESKAKIGLLPYLAIEAQIQNKNLLTLCDTGYTHGHFLPVLEGLVLTIQICDILEAAHSRNISYRDHKILHYYWDEAANGITMIDWNIAKRHPTGVSSEEARFDLVQFGARAMHHILTGRTAPGALPLGPTRPDEIEAAARSYQAQWTYDDQRLPKSIKDILENVMAGGYEKPGQLKEDLTLTFEQLSELANDEATEKPDPNQENQD